MNPAVHFHIALNLKAFVTEITFKWLLPGVCPDVIGQAVLLPKPLIADFSVRTVEWSLF